MCVGKQRTKTQHAIERDDDLHDGDDKPPFRVRISTDPFGRVDVLVGRDSVALNHGRICISARIRCEHRELAADENTQLRQLSACNKGRWSLNK